MYINKKIKNAKPTEYNGVKYRSKLESEFAKVFDENGVSFKYEPFKITLIPSFKYLGQTIRDVSYTPDFVVYNNIIIEAKGFPNDAYPLRKKMVLKYIVDNNYNYEFYEIKTKNQLLKLIEELKTKESCRQN